MGSRTKPDFVDGIRTNRTGRRTYAAELKRAVVKQCSEPGVSLAAVAMAHRINANLVRRWVVRHHRTSASRKATATATLLPVTIATTKSAVGDLETDECTLPSATTIELEVYGARIRLRGGVNATALRSVLDVLARR